MKTSKPVIAISMGDPAGIGPELIHTALCSDVVYDCCTPLVIGDSNILEKAGVAAGSTLEINRIGNASEAVCKKGYINLIEESRLDTDNFLWGRPDTDTGAAMVRYILKGIDIAMNREVDALVTGPINKLSMNLSGYSYNGHTELLAERTGTKDYAMMMAGNRLRVVLVTIHTAVKNVSSMISTEKIIDKIRLTSTSLRQRFGIDNPSIAVAALNPHAGEGGMFGDEEETIIKPAVDAARQQGIAAEGPFPPDTLFYHAVKGRYDAVVCMYHDQGLIPFKMIHFEDGVNTTLGLPIIRTSVDHGTAYDIAGKGKADPGSFIAAVEMAARQALNMKKTANAVRS